MADSIDDHRRFLDDPPRLDAFARAIAEMVRPGDVVADLGCGTGILALLACRAGASRVYAIDKTGIAAFARRIADDNGFGDRVIVWRGHSHRVDLPERVDVVLSDMVGGIGFIKDGTDTLADARRRWLKPHGRIMPETSTTWIAPIEQDELHGHIDAWSAPVRGIDMSALRRPAANTHYPHFFEPADLLAPGAPVIECDHRQDCPEVVRGTASFTIARAGRLHGLAGWCTAQLSPSVTFTNAPGAPDRIRRHNGFLPIDPPVAVERGDVIESELVIRPSDFLISWSLRCRRGSATLADCRHSTLAGMLVTRADLAPLAVHSQPVLNRVARARATTLALCDGQRELREIEQLVFERHADLFENQHQAQLFVAETLTRDLGASRL
jgi:protein arginine N-methyltransferase 1